MKVCLTPNNCSPRLINLYKSIHINAIPLIRVHEEKKSLLRSITQYVYMYHISNKYYIVKELLIQYITSVEDFISWITYECQ